MALPIRGNNKPGLLASCIQQSVPSQRAWMMNSKVPIALQTGQQILSPWNENSLGEMCPWCFIIGDIQKEGCILSQRNLSHLGAQRMCQKSSFWSYSTLGASQIGYLGLTIALWAFALFGISNKAVWLWKGSHSLVERLFQMVVEQHPSVALWWWLRQLGCAGSQSTKNPKLLAFALQKVWMGSPISKEELLLWRLQRLL